MSKLFKIVQLLHCRWRQRYLINKNIILDVLPREKKYVRNDNVMYVGKLSFRNLLHVSGAVIVLPLHGTELCFRTF